MKVLPRLLAAAVLGLPLVSHADPDEYVHEPAVGYGEREIDFKAGTLKAKDSGDRTTAASLGFGYGITQYWFTEAYVRYLREPGDRTKYDAFEWENKFLFTEPNQYFADVGFFIEFEVPKDHATAGYELRLGPLFQGDAGPIRWNANPLFTRRISGSEADHTTEMGYQAQAKYHVRREFEFGVQAFGEMGKWNHWDPKDEQNHRLGPAIFGKVKLEGRNTIVYNAAWLFGASKAAPDNAFRMQVEYEF